MATMTPAQVKALRDSMGHTQEEFAKHIPVGTRTVSRWETGEVSPSPMAHHRLKELHKQHHTKTAKPVDENVPQETGQLGSIPSSSGAESTVPRRRGIVPSSPLP